MCKEANNLAKTTTKPLAQTRKVRKAIDPEVREKQLIALAVNRAEQQLLDGTASSQVITHYLKLGTKNAELEREKLKKEVAVLEAKAEMLQANKNAEKKYDEVLKALKVYNGFGEENDYYHES